MLQVFQNESGGHIIATIDASVPAISGYAQFFGHQHIYYRLDGYITSGSLYISKSGVGQFQPSQYLMLPQVLDASGLLYFLTPVDVEVVYVPDFIQSAYFLSGDSFISGFIAHIEDHNNPHATTASQVGAEPALGNPTSNGYVLSSDTSGLRSWVAQTGGGGGGSDAYYMHTQSNAASTWTVAHNLGKKPSVSLTDSTGDEVYGNIHYDDDNQLTVTFSAALGGYAFCN